MSAVCKIRHENHQQVYAPETDGGSGLKGQGSRLGFFFFFVPGGKLDFTVTI